MWHTTATPWLLRDRHGDDGGGGTDLDGQILKSLDKLDEKLERSKTAQEKLLSDVTRLDSGTKTVLEDITLLKKTANDTQGNHDMMVKRFNLLDARLKAEARNAFGVPGRKIQTDPDLNTRFNIALRMAVDKNGDMRSVCKSIYERRKDELSEPTKKALGEDTSPGSTIIDDALALELYHTLQSYGIWNTFRVVPVGTKQTKFPVQTARVVANFVLTEAGTVADDTVKAGTSVTGEVEVIAALLNVSLQLIEDAEIDVTSNLMEDFAEAYALRLDYACTRADSTADATNGGMTGIIVGGTAAAAAAGNNTVETTDLEDWQRCLLTVDPAVLQRQARWWMHQQIVVRSLAVRDLNGRPLFLTALEAPSAGAVGSILGYPITMAAVMPTTNAAAATPAVFGDPGGLVVGMRRQYVFESSDHHRWNTLERSFRGWGRAGVKVRRAAAFGVLTLTA
jgi:HK97 family phage major capsid protein